MNEVTNAAPRRRFRGWVIAALAVSVVLLVGCGIGAYTGFSGTFEVSFTRDQAQKMVNEHMPLKVNQQLIAKKVPLHLVHDVVINNVDVQFVNGQVDVKSNVSAVILRTLYDIDGHTIGTPRFDHSPEDRGEVFFHPSKIELLGPPRANGADIGAKANSLIDRFGTKGMKEHKEEISAEVKDWAEKEVEHVFQNVLAKMPVYKLPDSDKGRIASAAIQNFRIDGDMLRITVSYTKAFGELTHIVFVYIGLGLLSLAVIAVLIGMAFTCPELLLLAALLP
jgi:hypothetical protein